MNKVLTNLFISVLFFLLHSFVQAGATMEHTRLRSSMQFFASRSRCMDYPRASHTKVCQSDTCAGTIPLLRFTEKPSHINEKRVFRNGLTTGYYLSDKFNLNIYFHPFVQPTNMYSIGCHRRDARQALIGNSKQTMPFAFSI